MVTCTNTAFQEVSTASAKQTQFTLLRQQFHSNISNLSYHAYIKTNMEIGRNEILNEILIIQEILCMAFETVPLASLEVCFQSLLLLQQH